MSPKPDVSTERKQQIYQAALACFSRKGYYQTTMDDIVTESGLSKGALYWYFDSKKQLFISLLQDFLLSTGEEWEAVIADETLNATEKLKACMTFFRKQFEEYVDFFGIVIAAWAQAFYDEDVQQLTRDLYEPYLAYMVQILEEGNAQGEFQVENLRATSAVILTIFDGLSLTSGTGIFDNDPSELLDAAESLIFYGLGIED